VTEAPWLRPVHFCLATLASTWRYEIIGAEHRHRAEAEGGPVVWAFWHGDLLPLLWLHRQREMTVLVSQHRDGERVQRLARRWGYRGLRGSSTHGGVTGLLGLARTLERGRQIAIAVDGPRGPRHRAKAGALALALRARASIVAVAAWAAPAWNAPSWDRFLVPAPGSRVRVAYAPAWQPDSKPSRLRTAERGPVQECLEWATRLAAH
jgi:lysophospholipid acyltransferase (LPLAT)-like uncharacterized protein